MKTIPLFLAVTLSLCTYSPAQDPKFREAEPRRVTTPAATAPADDSNAAAARISSMEQLDDTIPLRVGDRVSLRIVEDKDKTLSLNVQETGDIQAPHLGLVRVNGLTCKKVAYAMKRDLERAFFQQATVIVALEMRPRSERPGGGPVMPEDFFTVFGQVARQGKYEMLPDEDLTISQAILRAGGFAQFAKAEDVRIIRKVKTQAKPVEIRVNVKEIMTKGRLENDIPIRPNDVIIVKEKLINF